MGVEIQADESFFASVRGSSVIQRVTSSPRCTIYIYIYSHSRFTLSSHNSGDATFLFVLEGPSPGLTCGSPLNSMPTRARLCATVSDSSDLSMNAFELSVLVFMAWVLAAQSDILPTYAPYTILMRRDHTSVIRWVFKSKGGREPGPVTSMRSLGCVKVGSGWCFDAFHVDGVENTIADGSLR